MEVKFTKYKKAVILDGEYERLNQLAKLIDNDNISLIIENLSEHKKKKKSGIYSQIESDIAGFYEIDQSITSSWVLRPKYRGLRRTEIKKLLIDRIKSVKEGAFELPENLFEVNTIRIEIDERLIDVKEIFREDLDYILYQSIYYASEYYVDMVFERSFASWSKNFKLTDSEIEIVRKGDKKEITEMIHKKRNESST